MANILAADDSASMRQMVAYTLSNAGHSVVSAIDGQDALEKAKEQKFDLVLTDAELQVGNATSKSVTRLDTNNNGQ